MMKRNFFYTGSAVLLLSITILFSSCGKYPDGPSFSLSSKTSRISNAWTAVSVFRNDIDETEKFAVYAMALTKGGRATWIIQEEGQTIPAEASADWELANVKEAIKLTFDEKDPVSGETRLLFMDILRLTSDELWVRFLTEGDYYDVRFE